MQWKLCFAVLIAELLISSCGGLSSDTKLINNFQKHKDDLCKLQVMVAEDRLEGRIHATYADPKLPAERLAQYRALMAASGIMRLWATQKGKKVEFIVDATGFLDEGDYKGYLFSMANEISRADSLDESCFSRRSQDRYCTAVRPLDTDWWLLRYEYQ